MEICAVRLATRFGWLYAIVVFIYELATRKNEESTTKHTQPIRQ